MCEFLESNIMPSASLSFERFCSFLEQLNLTKSSEKKRKLRIFIAKWVEHCGPDVYDAIRLLLPKVCLLIHIQITKE